MQKFAAVLIASVAVTSSLFAVETRSWIQNEQSDFEKGTLTRVSIRSDGRLMLAPTLKQVFDSSTPYLWAIAMDSKGNLYTGGGGPTQSNAKLFEIDKSGKSKAIAEVPGMEIHAIAVNRNDDVFVATAPDGKVYRVHNGGKPEQFYDPKAKYIWALAFDSKGNLFVATGDQGEIHKVTPDGKGAVFFRTEETHARSMVVDGSDNLIVGTEPGGLILRVSQAGEGFVLYQAAKREVTAVAVAKDGTIYAAAIGNKSGASGGGGSAPSISVPAIAPTPVTTTSSDQVAAVTTTTITGGGATVTPTPMPPPTISGGTEVYRIDRDNYPRRIWSSTHDIAYAIAFDAQGRPVVGTGNKGRLFRIDSDVASTLLLVAQPTQITNLIDGRDGSIYAACGNIGEVLQVGPGTEKQGTYESDPFDVGSFSYWGRVDWLGERGNGNVAFETRSGNLDRPQKNWSPWTPVDMQNGARVSSPAARFLQYRATLTNSGQGRSPEITQVEIAYMAKNAAPIVETLEATPANYRFPATATISNAIPSGSPASITLQPLAGQRRRATASLTLDVQQTSMTYAKGYIGARWAAMDPNGDDLTYRLEIRGVNETQWKLLKDKVHEKTFSWDSTAFPDGRYVLRITASDAASNAPSEALANTLESDPFLIDNTPPEVTKLEGTRSGNGVTVRWHAQDASSTIDKAEYSIDGKEWTMVEPTTRLSDSPQHDYVLTLSGVDAGEHTIAVRVQDDFDNLAVAKTIIR